MPPLGLALLLGVAPPEGVVRFGTSPGARLEIYPRPEVQRFDLIVRDNRMPLAEQVDGLSARFMKEIEVVDIGSGTWFVTVHVDSDDVLLVPELENARLLLRRRSGPAEGVEPVEIPDVETLIVSPPQRQAAPPPHVPLTPLGGDAMTLALPVRDLLREPPVWDTPDVEAHPVRGWPAIDAYRSSLTSKRSPALQAQARYRLGIEHLRIGWYRDAVYYLEDVLSSSAPFDVPAVSLAAALGHLILGHHRRTRDLCGRAWRGGADDVTVLECLGGVALVSGAPSPTHVGRALAAASPKADHQLLAAQLLQQDHRQDEALSILEALAGSTEGGRVYASLGDARYATGDLAGAKEAWAEAASDPLLMEQIAGRALLANMVDDGPAGWSSRIPNLLAASRSAGPAGAEAHYLLAQVAETYGDPDLAAEHLNRLWDRFPALTLRSDVPERLVGVCGQRLDMLEASKRDTEQVAFFAACWRQELDELATDPSLLRRTARLLAGIGLIEEALFVQQRAVAVHTRLNIDDPATLLELAHLYVATDRAKEAMQTLSYVRMVGGASPAAFHVAEAETLLASGDVEGALAAWTQAEVQGAAIARLRRGQLLAREDRCAEAVPALQGTNDPTGRLDLARCLVRLGRDGEAAAALPTEAPQPELLEDAAWLQGVVAARGDAAVPPPDGVWAVLEQEEDRAKAFEEKLEKRR